jgi:hypothetical protein
MRLSACLAVLTALGFSTPVAAEITVEKSDRGAVVKIDGQLFTEYLTKSGNKPVLWPIVAPGGKRVTRGYPIEPQPGETNDHIHQRGLWFTHGDVNGVMFWNEEKGSGEIRHREFTKLEGGETGTIVARNDWLAPGGKRVCTEVQTFRFSGDDKMRIIDARLTLHASDGELKFGDNKEGSFGLRVADTMRIEARLGGQIITSESATNESAWGQPAKWVDYHGPVDGEVLGVAILDHPSNPSHPVRWHVRPYGLFAANPFARQAFDFSQIPASITVPAGESITFRYRVIVHRGDEKEGKVAEHYAEFAK